MLNIIGSDKKAINRIKEYLKDREEINKISKNVLILWFSFLDHDTLNYILNLNIPKNKIIVVLGDDYYTKSIKFVSYNDLQILLLNYNNPMFIAIDSTKGYKLREGLKCIYEKNYK